jgi:hypothetical protein
MGPWKEEEEEEEGSSHKEDVLKSYQVQVSLVSRQELQTVFNNLFTRCRACVES